jgi:hypothetical protein
MASPAALRSLAITAAGFVSSKAIGEMMAQVVISCSHPTGIILEDALGNRVVLAGPPRPANGLNPGYGNTGAGLTSVDSGTWASVAAYHAASHVILHGIVKQVG